MSNPLPKLIAVVGPTAAGKSDVAIALAQEQNGEVVSADSRQLYRGFVIGAGVVPGKLEVRNGKEVWVSSEGVVHHLINTIDPATTLTLSEYKVLAETAIDDIIARGKTPILCGGTGLYISAVVDNFSMPEVAPDPGFRTSAETRTTEDLFAELQAKDPDYAARITPENRRYIIRALEVCHVTGQTFSALQRRSTPKYETTLIGIVREKGELIERITRRVYAQVDAGVIEEVRQLAETYGWEVPAMTGIGYREWRPYLDGTATKDACLSEIIRNTVHFAKRQMTWFKRDSRIQWQDGSHK